MNRVALSNPLKTDPELGMSSYLRFMAGIVITALKDLKKKKKKKEGSPLLWMAELLIKCLLFKVPPCLADVVTMHQSVDQIVRVD